MSFDGLRVLVTGSTRGIGRATAAAFLAQGAIVAVHGRRGEDVARTADVLGGQRLCPVAGDLSTRAACYQVVEAAVDALGGLDILVNNAGVFTEGPIEDVSEETYDWLMNANVKGVFFCSQAAVPALRTAQGSIVNVSSESGLVGNLNMALYCASKGAVTNMTRSLAFELAPEVRVNAVCPGSTMTDMLTGQADQLDPDLPDFRSLIEFAPMKRIAEPEEIADGILFLANPASKFVTGSMLSIDGGSTATR
jgi:meso-butanediol dehydrogenase / (S,S)-butanediol dehydrogenase / diacetyl reductase